MNEQELKEIDKKRDELRTIIIQHKDKFVYYIISLSVTAIGFSIYKTTGQNLKLIQVPLGASLILWAVSIYSGFKFTILRVSEFSRHMDVLLQIQWKGNTDPSVNELIATTKKIEAHGTRQQWFFYFGIIFFLIWHILEMYCVPKINCWCQI